MKIVVFAYDFPNKKTQDFLLRLFVNNIRIEYVIAAPYQRIGLPKTNMRDKYKDIDLVDPEWLCHKLGVKYMKAKHNSDFVFDLINDISPDLGIIAGARMLNERLISSFETGIMNFHPGIIPYNRGLNCAKWAIVKDIPQGVTVHLIDKRIDAGFVLRRYCVPLFFDDTIRDINRRIYQTQILVLDEIMESVISGKIKGTPVTTDEGYHSPADKDVDLAVQEKFDSYIKKWMSIEGKIRCICNEFVNLYTGASPGMCEK